MSNNRIRVEHFRYTYEYVPTIMTKSAFDSLLFIVLIAERERERESHAIHYRDKYTITFYLVACYV